MDNEVEPVKSGQFKNGDDVYFDYSGDKNGEVPAGQSISNKSSSNKKKKKKKKGKNKQNMGIEASISDPTSDYPDSRVIKQAPNGDVIVERLEENDTYLTDERASRSIWENSTMEEQENLRNFWESLEEPEKLKLIKIDKKDVMEMFKHENKPGYHHNHQTSGALHSSGEGAHGSHSSAGGRAGPLSGSLNGNTCTCSFCGRKNNYIEHELESIYDHHFDDIIDFIHEIRDINDLNALPGLLFGGFHMLEAEHRLQKRQRRSEHGDLYDQTVNSYSKQPYTNSDASSDCGCEHDHDHEHDHEHNFGSSDSIAREEHTIATDGSHTNQSSNETETHKIAYPSEELSKLSIADQKLEISKVVDESDKINDTAHEASNTTEEDPFSLLSKQDDNLSQNDDLSAYNAMQSNDRSFFRKLLDPKLYESLGNLDNSEFECVNDSKGSDVSSKIDNPAPLKEFLHELRKADKGELERGMAFLKNLGAIYSNKSNKTLQLDELDDQLSMDLLNFAEEFIKNGGSSFIDMMETLSETRAAKEESPDGQPEVNSSEDLSSQIKEIVNEKETSSADNAVGLEYEQSADVGSEVDRDEDIDERESNILNDDIEFNAEIDDLEDEEDDDAEEAEGYSDTESEICEEERMQEIRRLFLIQVIKLFQERLRKAYKEKLSQERTRKLIEELEAEENAKKERELKKLKQKEKAKEKKRLQQLAKEEERKRKEEEQRLKEEKLREQQEALRAEQIRKKEETKLKKEEEKRKRIEELQRKEKEHQKQLEEQRKREEEKQKQQAAKKKAEKEQKRKEAEEKLKEKQKQVNKKNVDPLDEVSSKPKQEPVASPKTEPQQYDADRPIQIRPLELDPVEQINNLLPSQLDGFKDMLPQLDLRVTNDELNFRPSDNIHDQLVIGLTKENGNVSPSKNHILDQLYHAKPRSLSNAGPLSRHSLLGAKHPTSDIANNDLVPPILPRNSYNLLQNNGALNNIQSGNNIGPWPSSSLNLNSQNQLMFQLQPTQPNTFGLFDRSYSQSLLGIEGNDSISASGFGNPMMPEPLAGTQQTPPVWSSHNSASRNGSIWNNGPQLPSSNLWGKTGSTLNSGGSQMGSLNHGATLLPQVGGMGSLANPMLSPTNNIDPELVKTAACQAFKILERSNQLEFGVAPALLLYQTGRSLLSTSLLSLSQFLTCCKNTTSLSGFSFDFIYDEFGTVTYIKMIVNPMVPSSQGSFNSTLMNSTMTSTPTSGNLNLVPSTIPSNDSVSLNPLNDFASTNSFASGPRGLWN